MTTIEQFEATLGVHFHNPTLLLQALTHRSYANEASSAEGAVEHNERLEFLGDAVLDFIAGDWLFQQFPNMREGKLTRLRSALVCTEMLAEFALQVGLDEVIRLGYGEAENGGRTRSTNLCAAFEALIGALYLDRGMESARALILPLFQPALQNILQKVSTKDPKSRLQEWSQSQPDRITPTYYTIASYGPDHAKSFVIEVRLNDQLLGWGNGPSKRIAEQEAARMVLEELDKKNTTLLQTSIE